MAASTKPTHYQTLGVEPTATQDQVRRAYRALAKLHHPDVNTAKDSAAKFARIAAAYEVLSDRSKRKTYDDSLAPRRSRATTGGEDHASGFPQGHYVWVNVAGRPSKTKVDIAEVDELFDTFFGGSKPSKPAAKASKPAATQGKTKRSRDRAS